MDFRMLGSLEVADGEADVPIRGAKQRTLLALLLVRPGATVSAERLADELWGDDAPGGGANALQSLVSKLRRALGANGSLLATDANGYRLAVGPDDIDASRFEAAAARGRDALAAGDPAAASKHLAAALGLWRGEALAGLADDGVLRREAARLEEARLAALEDRCEADLLLGRHAELVGELESLVSAHPLRERLHGFVMLALYRAGRQAEALRAYQHARQLLSDELGLEPSAHLRALEAAILAQDPVLQLELAAPVAAPATRRTNLGGELSRFIGRKDDLNTLGRLVAEHRLVTVVGPGGAGKTRLAREVGTNDGVRAGEPDVWMVELAALVDPAGVGDAIAAAVGAGEQSLVGDGGLAAGAALDRAAERIAGRATLLILDNCEHLVAEAARAAEHLLRACARLHILATSREGLGIGGETLWAVPPMAIEDGVTLFADRAGAAASFQLTPATEEHVRDLCARLDGLPLAIELAAARTRAIPVHQLTARLDDRFRLLTGGTRTALPRQQTLRAVVEWSYDLLFDDERTVFECLSVFAGGCSLEAAEAVCACGDVEPGDVADLLAHLVDKSLVVADHSGDEARYHLLQTLALYGRERLSVSGEAEGARARHAAHFAGLAARGTAAFRGHDQTAWLAEVQRESDNLRVAEAWTIEQGDAEQALTIAGGLGWSWWLSGHAEEGHRLIESALACPGAAKPATRALAAMWASYVGANAGTGMERAIRWGEEAITLWRQSGDPTGLKETLVLHANVLAALGRRSEAAAAFAEARRLNGPGDDDWHRAVALYAEGRLAAMEDDPEVAERLQLESVTWFEAAGAAWATATVNADVAALAEGRGDLASAIERTERALDAARTLAMGGEEAFLLGRLGNLWLSTGDHVRAEAYHEEALALSDELGFRPGAAMALNGRALARRLTGRLEEAEACAQRALSLYTRSESAAGEALSLATLGFVAELRGQLDEARMLHEHGLAVARRTGGLGAIALALEGLAGVAAASGDGERAARLLGHAHHLRQQYGGAWAGPASDVERITDVAMAIVGGEAFDAAHRQGATSDLESMLV